jgi:hypothetical protein
VPAALKKKIFPGILTSLGDGYRADKNMLNSMMNINRKYGYMGEVLFYYETIRETTEPLYK